MKRMFISYTWDDGIFVDQLTVYLKNLCHIFVDKMIIVTGTPLIHQINAYIETSDYMIAIISKNSIKSRWVNQELAIAYEELLQGNISIIPVIIDNIKLPAMLRSIHFIDVRNMPDNKKPREAASKITQVVSHDILISGNFLLEDFIPWGGVNVIKDPHGVRINSIGYLAGASGIVYEGVIHTIGFDSLVVNARNSKNSSFIGYARRFPLSLIDRLSPVMLKVELDSRPLMPNKMKILSLFDKSYIKPADGAIVYPLPQEIKNRGYLTKLEFVFGSGEINDLELSAKLN